MSEYPPSRRREWKQGGQSGSGALLALDDDALLLRIQSPQSEPATDSELLEVVRSDRHFFIRQEAAKRVRDKALLKEHAHDRHIGQILVRAMTRREDRTYLERLVAESRHLEVRRAAEQQLRAIGSADC